MGSPWLVDQGGVGERPKTRVDNGALGISIDVANVVLEDNGMRLSRDRCTMARDPGFARGPGSRNGEAEVMTAVSRRRQNSARLGTSPATIQRGRGFGRNLAGAGASAVGARTKTPQDGPLRISKFQTRLNEPSNHWGSGAGRAGPVAGIDGLPLQRLQSPKAPRPEGSSARPCGAHLPWMRRLPTTVNKRLHWGAWAPASARLGHLSPVP